MLYVILCTMILNRGAKDSNMFNYVLTVAKVVTLTFIAVVGLTYFNGDNMRPFFLEEQGGFKGTL